MEKTSHVESRKVIYQELKDAFKGILNNHKYINSLSKKREEIIPSAEWLLDNIYLIEKEYKNIYFNSCWYNMFNSFYIFNKENYKI